MRPKQKYRLPSSRDSQSSGFLWLLVLIALAALAWVWWHARELHKAIKPPPAKIAAQPSTNAPRILPTPLRTIFLAATNAPLVVTNRSFPRAVQNAFEAQVALDRRGISSGSLDGKIGSQTRGAIRAFQLQEGISATGDLDAATRTRMTLATTPLANYVVTTNDLARLQPLGKSWLEKSRQTALDFETLLELVAEKSHAHPALIQKLNPNVNWTNVTAGAVVQVPDAERIEPTGKAAFVKISLSEKTLEAFDAGTNLLAHFPCSIAQRVEKRPVGELNVAVLAPDPNYTFDPEVFPESPEAHQLKTKLVIPPGPNNPVGVVWIGLDKPGYGVHGTPSPELVGRTESHGCFRLANWNAEYLLKLVWIGMPVYVQP